MRRHPVAARLLLACGALGAAGGDGGFATTAPAGAPCVNFGQAGPALYRGAEPDDACLRHLAGLGITMVVNLRDDDEDSGHEQARVVALGMRYVNLPLSGFGRPAKADVRRVLALIDAPGNRPVFVHCRHGRDRTGVIIAAHRMAEEGWTAERALQEAEDFGLAWWQFRMRRFILDFGREVRTAPSGSETR